MTTFIKKTALRRSINSLLVVAMLFSLVVVPAFAAEPSTAEMTITKVSGSTNLDHPISVEATNGLNGTHSIEITGTVASKTTLEGVGGLTLDTELLRGLKIPNLAGEYNDLVISWGTDAAADASATVKGLGATSTVKDVIDAINKSMEASPAAFTATLVKGRVKLEAKKSGRTYVQVNGTNPEGLAAKLFGSFIGGFKNPAAGYGEIWVGGSDYGLDYDGATSPFIINDVFESEGTTLAAGYYNSADAGASNMKVGSINVYGNAVAGTDANGLYNTVTLAPGYGVVLATSGGLGLDKGISKFNVSGGTRNANGPKTATVDQSATVGAQAGEIETITVSAVATGNVVPSWNDSVNAIDAMKIELPAGFKAVAGSAKVMSSEGTVVVGADGSLAVSKFKSVVGKPIEVQFRSQVPTAAGEYAVKGQYRNIGGGSFKAFDFSGKIKVIGLNAVSKLRFVDASPVYARAGQQVSIDVEALDKFDNVISNPRYFTMTTPNSAITVPSKTDPRTLVADGKFTGVIGQLKNAEGTATVTFNVFTDNTTETAESTGTIDVCTVGVKAPMYLEVYSKKSPVTAGTSATVGVRLLDEGKRRTAFLDGDLNKPTSFVLYYGPAWNGTKFERLSKVVPIPTRAGFGTVELPSTLKDTEWQMWAVDGTGLLQQSPVVTQAFVSDSAAAVSDTAVVADPALVGEANYGYAYADGTSKVTFTVKTGTPNVTVYAKADPTASNVAQAGILNAASAKTDAAGVATFTVSSFSSSKDGLGFTSATTSKSFKKFDFSTGEAPLGSGYAHFYVAMATKVSVDKRVVFTDGIEKATLTYTLTNPVTDKPATDVQLFFSVEQSGVKVEPLSGTTNADGRVSVSLSSKVATSGVVVTAKDGNGSLLQFAQGVVVEPVDFADYKLIATGELKAQRSSQGALVRTSAVLVDALGAPIQFSNITSASGIVSGADGKSLVSTVTAQFTLPANLVEGDTYHKVFKGTATLTDVFGSAHDYAYASDMFVTVDNKATATARASVLNIENGNANVSGTGFRPNLEGVTVALTEGGSSRAFGADVYTDANGTLLTRNRFNITGLLPGTYDVWVDGIKFAGGLTVVQGFDIGVKPVYVSLVSDSGSSYLAPNTASKLVGAVTKLAGTPIEGKKVSLFASKTADGMGVEIASAITDQAGRFTFNVKPAASTYYYVISEGDAEVLAGDSRNFGRVAAVFVKTVAKLSVTSYPTAPRVGRSYTVKASLPKHAAATTTYVKVLKKSGTKWVAYKSYRLNVAAAATSVSGKVVFGSKGYYKVRVYHADANHLASYSAYKYMTVK